MENKSWARPSELEEEEELKSRNGPKGNCPTAWEFPIQYHGMTITPSKKTYNAILLEKVKLGKK